MNNGKKLKLFFRLSWKTAPSYILLLIVQTLTSGGQVAVNVVLPKFLIDELTGACEMKRLLFFGGLVVGSNLFFAWFTRLMKRYMDVQNPYVSQKMEQLLGEKVMSLPYARLEEPYYLDLKERAAFAFLNQEAMLNMITGLAELLQKGSTLLGLTIIMLTLSPVLVGILLVLIGVMLLLQRRLSIHMQKIHQLILPINRRYGYYVNMTFDDKVQRDVRLYDMAGMLGDRVAWYNRDMTETFGSYRRQEGFYMGLYSAINDLQAAISYGYVGLRVITDWFGGRIGLGSFTMYVNAAVQFSTNITGFGTAVIRLGQLLGYLDPFMELMELPDEQEALQGVAFSGPVESIVFENVDFTYPGSEKKVLDQVSFSVKKGEKIAVVGLNGAGKTTLIKLLCRLYQPGAGRILVNGRDIQEYDYASYMAQLAAVFQDYRLFNFTIEENISCREVGQDEKMVKKLVDQVGLEDKMKELPKGLHTLLGKAYDEEGTELSGGQEQKVAIARALYKDASLIILDEPTSALDPLAEAEIYENFNELAGGKTAFYISHRMSSSVFCDRVLVIDGGKVADFAPHGELMKKEGSLYRKMFEAQAENYV
ncbi:MAG: ABC transporter ATP-binding protein [Lachnospiraceae bacterium]|nr:ABC transporter ATP-binding protein [Lachnospiraceae bacterium]